MAGFYLQNSHLEISKGDVWSFLNIHIKIPFLVSEHTRDMGLGFLYLSNKMHLNIKFRNQNSVWAKIWVNSGVIHERYLIIKGKQDSFLRCWNQGAEMPLIHQHKRGACAQTDQMDWLLASRKISTYCAEKWKMTDSEQHKSKTW